MAKNFTIKLSEIGTLTGTWIPATASLVAIALNTPSGVQPQTSPATCAFFAGPITLSGGNPWDGTYANINDIPISGMVPHEGLSVLRGRFVGPGVPPANTLSIGSNSPLFDQEVGAVAGVTLNLEFNYTGIRSLFTLATELLGASVTSAVPGVINIERLYIDGTYDVVSWSWGVANGIDFTVPTTPTQAGKLFAPEATVEIQSGSPVGDSEGDIENIYTDANPDGTGPSLAGEILCGDGSGDGIDGIILSWYDPVTEEYDYIIVEDEDFIEHTCIIITFILPPDLPPDIPITVSPRSPNFPPIPPDPGVQFSGSVKLGVIKILNTAASGLYKIVADKTHDTIYIDSPTTDDTANFKFPDPFAKTGLIGG